MTEPILLNGHSLTIEQVLQVAYENTPVELAPEALGKVARAAWAVQELLRRGEIAYGITTGFGAFKDHIISPDQVEILQRNILISHAVGVGDLLDTPTTRAVMLIRANTLARGHSGIRPETLRLLLEMLNRGVHPCIPEKGSLGASGDLAPLAHMALVLIGEGEAEFQGQRLTGLEALRRASLQPVTLAAKEGLALTNGTSVMCALGVLAVDQAERLSRAADIAGCLSLEALHGTALAFDERIHALRPHPRQVECAAHLRSLLAGSDFTRGHDPANVQDAYTLRCIPQVHGAVRDAIAYARWVIEIELNAVTDNPLIFVSDAAAQESSSADKSHDLPSQTVALEPSGSAAHDSPNAAEAAHQLPGDNAAKAPPNPAAVEIAILSGGNFHGEPIAIALDYLAIAMTELGNISERRTMRLTDEASNTHTLPAFLTENGGLNSGFMLTQYTAAALATENKVLAHPASVDTIPTSANVEDHVSMGATAALKLRQVLDNVETILGIELFAACQGVDFRRQALGPHTRLGAGTAPVYALVRQHVPFLTADAVMYPYIHTAKTLIASGQVDRAGQA
jgi:histidine ammonia-lyase